MNMGLRAWGLGCRVKILDARYIFTRGPALAPTVRWMLKGRSQDALHRSPVKYLRRGCLQEGRGAAARCGRGAAARCGRGTAAGCGRFPPPPAPTPRPAAPRSPHLAHGRAATARGRPLGMRSKRQCEEDLGHEKQAPVRSEHDKEGEGEDRHDGTRSSRGG